MFKVVITLLLPTWCIQFLISSCNQNQSTEYTTPSECSSDLIPKGSGSKSNQENDELVDEVKVGALNIGRDIIEELELNLRNEGYNVEQTKFIGAVAEQSLSVSVGSFVADTNPITEVMSPIIEGSFVALSDTCAKTDEIGRTKAVQAIMNSTTGSLRGRTDGLALTGFFGVIEKMTGAAVESLDDAGIDGELTSEGVAALTIGTVGALARAGLEGENIGGAAKSAALGAVQSLGSIGQASIEMGRLAGTVAASAMSGLVKTGLSGEEIVDSGAISGIVSGASTGLKAAGVSDSEMGVTIGSIAGFAIRAFESTGLNSVETKQKALSAVIDGAVTGSSAQLLSDTLLEVSKEAVSNLLDSGFATSDIAEATSVIIKTGVSKIVASGISDATVAVNLASQLIKGTMEATARLEVKGKIDSTQSAKSGASAMTSAIEAVNEFQQAGIVDATADLSSLKNTLGNSVSTGFIAGGASSESQAVVRSSVQIVVEREVVASPAPAPSSSASSQPADTVSPTVTRISITTPNGTYGEGQSITIVVQFSEVVLVSGTPTIALETGSIDRNATYVSGSGTDSLTFTYVIQSADDSSALDYQSTSSLGLNGGSIKDAANNSAVLTLGAPGGGSSLVAGKSIVVDTYVVQCDSNFAGKNLLRSVASQGTATVKQVTGISGATLYATDNLAEVCSGAWQSQGTFCDDGDARDSMTLSYKASWNNIATWNSGGVNGIGVLVVDLGAVRVFNKLRIFQMHGDGKTTHINFYTHSETGATAPLHADVNWSSSILPGGNYVYVNPGTYALPYVSDPTAIDFTDYVSTRYLKIHAKSDNSQGADNYIEIRSIKMFCD